MPDSMLPKNTGFFSYRAEINNGQQLRDKGFLSETCDVLFLYGADDEGSEHQLCWLEMSEDHDAELDELMKSLPHSGVMAVVLAMVARRDSLNSMIAIAKAVRHG